MMVVAVVVVVEERAKWWRSIMVEATQPGRPADRDDPSGGEGPCSKARSVGRHRGEGKRRAWRRRRDRTRRNRSGPVTRSRGEERGPPRTTATHCPTHRDRRRSCLYLSIQETRRDPRSASTPLIR